MADLRTARRALASGATTVRVLGVNHFAGIGIRVLNRRGAVDLPGVIAAGYHVRPRPAEELFLNLPELRDLISGVAGAAAVRRLVSALINRGVNVIKIMATERAGVRSIEHGTCLSEKTLALLKAQGTCLVPTVATVMDLAEPGGDYDHPELSIRGRAMLPRLRAVVAQAWRVGVRIAAGADTGYGPARSRRARPNWNARPGCHQSVNLRICRMSRSRENDRIGEARAGGRSHCRRPRPSRRHRRHRVVCLTVLGSLAGCEARWRTL